MTQVSHIGPDGLRILANASLENIARDRSVMDFADGLLVQALNLNLHRVTLAEALQSDGRDFYPLLTALLVVDAEVDAVIDDNRRVFPLPGFLTYRARLPLNKFPLNTLRLPPLNSGGRYLLTDTEQGGFLALRLDIHPQVKLMGHVRLAVCGLERPPERLSVIEHRLDRQVLSDEMIAEVAAISSRGQNSLLRDAELEQLLRLLRAVLITDAASNE